MIDKIKAKEAIAEMCKNPDWKDVLAHAPGAAGLRIGLAFYASKNLSEMDQKQKDEYREFREMLERQLNAVELKYLAEEFKRMGVEAAATHYQELLSKKPPEEQTDAEQKYQEIVKQASESKQKVADFQAKYGDGEAEGKGGEQPDSDENGEGANASTEESTEEYTAEDKPQAEGENEGEEDDGEEKKGEEAQDEAPTTPSSHSAAIGSTPADSSAGSGPAPAPASAEQQSLPGFSDDDMKAFLERGKAMLTKGIRIKGAKKQ